MSSAFKIVQRLVNADVLSPTALNAHYSLSSRMNDALKVPTITCMHGGEKHLLYKSMFLVFVEKKLQKSGNTYQK